MTDVQNIQSLAGCTEEQAIAALQEHGSVIAAVDALLPKTTVSGAKYIPSVAKTTHETDPEQELRCATGRALMDKITAVTSAAHSKIRSGQSLAGGVVGQSDQ
jgi:hypothetical protein